MRVKYNIIFIIYFINDGPSPENIFFSFLELPNNDDGAYDLYYIKVCRNVYIYIYLHISIHQRETRIRAFGGENDAYFSPDSAPPPRSLCVRGERDVIDKYICIIHRARQFRSPSPLPPPLPPVSPDPCAIIYASRDAESRRITRVSGREETSPVCGIVVWGFRGAQTTGSCRGPAFGAQWSHGAVRNYDYCSRKSAVVDRVVKTKNRNAG